MSGIPPDSEQTGQSNTPSGIVRYRFRPHERVRDGRHFRRAFDRRRAVSDAMMVVHAAPNGLPSSRLGISVPRKQARKASRRNRLKRYVREAFRLTKSSLPQGLDFIVVPRDTKLTFAQALQSLPALAREAARRLGHETAPPPPPAAP